MPRMRPISLLPDTGAQPAPAGSSDPRWPQDFGHKIIAWQHRHGRHGLPWQGLRDAYAVWLSEIMLQQTQVATVLDYYPRFLARFPTVQALAEAPVQDVLALWSGLGYYSRARNLHRCAQEVVRLHGGVFPATAQALAGLPGIGPSTAAAIAAFCFDERVAIFDGNVKRVLARVLAFDGDLARTAPARELHAMAERLLPPRGLPAYTQGLMDLGATLCTVRTPHCADCPVQADCRARAAGEVHRYPLKTRRLKRGTRHDVWLWLEHEGRLWLSQRPDQGIWAGLYSLPQWPDMPSFQAAAGQWPGHGECWPALVHVLTHLDWHLQPVRWRLPARTSAARLARITAEWGPGGRWASPEEALELGVPAPLRKLLLACDQLETTPLPLR